MAFAKPERLIDIKLGEVDGGKGTENAEDFLAVLF